MVLWVTHILLAAIDLSVFLKNLICVREAKNGQLDAVSFHFILALLVEVYFKSGSRVLNCNAISKACPTTNVKCHGMASSWPLHLIRISSRTRIRFTGERTDRQRPGGRELLTEPSSSHLHTSEPYLHTISLPTIAQCCANVTYLCFFNVICDNPAGLYWAGQIFDNAFDNKVYINTFYNTKTSVMMKRTKSTIISATLSLLK